MSLLTDVLGVALGVSLAVNTSGVLANESLTKHFANQDYHLSVYFDVLEQPLDIELFTKHPEKQIFFGVGCSTMSPLPMLQLILKSSDSLSESPKLLQVRLNTAQNDWLMNGVLKPDLSSGEISNRVLLQLESRGQSMTELQALYKSLLEELSSGEDIRLEVSHRTLKPQSWRFSVKGLGELVSPYLSVCFQR
jgi:hypothetical protein